MRMIWLRVMKIYGGCNFLFVYLFYVSVSKIGGMVGLESFFDFLIYHFTVIRIQVQVIQFQTLP